MSHHVYLVEYLGAPRNHHAIFIETDDSQSGYLYHVKGTIQDGMTYEVKHRSNPEQSTTFAKKTYLGWVNEPDYSRVNDICGGVPPPKKQFKKGRRLDPGCYPSVERWRCFANPRRSSRGILGLEPGAQRPLPCWQRWNISMGKSWAAILGDKGDGAGTPGPQELEAARLFPLYN